MSDSQDADRDSTLLVFDGDCGFCTSSVRWLDSHLPAPARAVPWQWAELEGLGLSEEEARSRVWFVTPTHHHGGHLALAELLRRQPTLGWRFLGNLLRTPGFSMVAALGYALVARFRYLLPGGTPACRVGSTG